MTASSTITARNSRRFDKGTPQTELYHLVLHPQERSGFVFLGFFEAQLGSYALDDTPDAIGFRSRTGHQKTGSLWRLQLKSDATIRPALNLRGKRKIND